MLIRLMGAVAVFPVASALSLAGSSCEPYPLPHGQKQFLLSQYPILESMERAEVVAAHQAAVRNAWLEVFSRRCRRLG